MFEATRPPPTNTIASARDEGAFSLWEKGIYGEGITVAVLDSGVNEEGVVGEQLAWRVDLTGETQLGDLSGHGTQMSEFILGYAPKAKIVSVRVVDKDGLVTRDALVRGLEFCAEHYPEIRVVNVSLGIIHRFASWTWCTMEKPCSLCSKTNEVVASGLIVVAAAGNRKISLPRLSHDTLKCPGNAKDAYTVGAVGRSPKNRRGKILRKILPSFYYRSESSHTGTSVAAAFSSGGMALLLSAIDDLSMSEIREALDITATPLIGDPRATGTGQVHFYRGYKLLLHKRAGKLLDPELAYYHFLTGLGLRQAGNTRKSLSEFQRAIALEPTNQLFHNELGLAYLDGHMLWRALESFREAVRTGWQSAIPHDNLGLTLERLGRKEEALKHYEVALQLDPWLQQAAFHIWHLMQSR